MKIEPGAEEVLLMRCLGADKNALRELAEKYGQPVYDFLCKISGEHSSRNQKILLHSFSEAFKLYDAAKPKESFLTLVLRALVREAGSETGSKTFLLPENIQLKSQWILEALKLLPMRQRAVILLRTQMDLQYTEMAFVLSEPVAAVKLELKESRLLLREKISDVMKDHYREMQSSPRTNA